MATDTRRRIGTRGERLAEAYLDRAGYRVVARNARTRSGEIDLIAAGGGCIVFCEVRSRIGTERCEPRGAGGPLESIGPGKRRRLRRLAREWLAARAEERGRAARTPADLGLGAVPWDAESLRFDAIGVILAPDGTLISLEHVENAF